jgi:hypothetical protein
LTASLGGCCCEKGMPVSNLPRERGLRSGEDESPLGLAFVHADFGVRASAIRYLDIVPGGVAFSGPSLLALYCTWLK